MTKKKIKSAHFFNKKKMPENLDNSPSFRAIHTRKIRKYNLGTLIWTIHQFLGNSH